MIREDVSVHVKTEYASNVHQINVNVDQTEYAWNVKSIGRKDAWPLRKQTTSLVQESDILGRDADTDAVLNLLQEDGVDENAIGGTSAPAIDVACFFEDL